MASAEFSNAIVGWEGLPADAERIWAEAAEDLSVQDLGGTQDGFLWEHSQRVLTSIPKIMVLLGEQGGSLDRAALFAAALYHDAGWAVQFRDGAISRWEILARPAADVQQELAAGLAEERLGGRLPAASLEMALGAIRGLNSRDVEVRETQVLADADSLEQIGPLAFWQAVRLNASRGRGIQACVDAWRSQQEYHFWEARLDRLWFAPVRRIAEKRLQALDQFIQSVALLARGEDLQTGAPSVLVG